MKRQKFYQPQASRTAHQARFTKKRWTTETVGQVRPKKGIKEENDELIEDKSPPYKVEADYNKDKGRQKEQRTMGSRIQLIAAIKEFKEEAEINRN